MYCKDFCHFSHSPTVFQEASSMMTAQTYFCICNYTSDVLSTVALNSHAVCCYHSSTEVALWSQPIWTISLTSSGDNHSKIYLIKHPSWHFKKKHIWFLHHPQASSPSQSPQAEHRHMFPLPAHAFWPLHYWTEQGILVENQYHLFSLPWTSTWWFLSERGSKDYA